MVLDYRHRFLIATALWFCLAAYRVHVSIAFNSRVFGFSDTPTSSVIAQFLGIFISPFVYAAVGYAAYWCAATACSHFKNAKRELVPFRTIAVWVIAAFLILYAFVPF